MQDTYKMDAKHEPKTVGIDIHYSVDGCPDFKQVLPATDTSGCNAKDVKCNGTDFFGVHSHQCLGPQHILMDQAVSLAFDASKAPSSDTAKAAPTTTLPQSPDEMKREIELSMLLDRLLPPMYNAIHNDITQIQELAEEIGHARIMEVFSGLIKYTSRSIAKDVAMYTIIRKVFDPISRHQNPQNKGNT